MKIVGSNIKRRGDLVVTLNKSRLRALAVGSAAVSGVLFVIGFSLGRFTASTPENPPPTYATVSPSAFDPSAATERTVIAQETASASTPSPLAQPVVVAEKPAAAPIKSAPAVKPPAAQKPAAVEKPKAETKPVAKPEPSSGPRFAIVVRSLPVGNDPQGVQAQADKLVAELKAKGFRGARAEPIQVPEKGLFIRVIAREGAYPSSTVAKNDLEAMKRRGEVASGWVIPLDKPR